MARKTKVALREISSSTFLAQPNLVSDFSSALLWLGALYDLNVYWWTNDDSDGAWIYQQWGMWE